MKITVFIILIVSFLIPRVIGCREEVNLLSPPKSKWILFTKANTAGIIDDNIKTIMKANNGEIWFGSDSGAFSYRSKMWASLTADSLVYYVYPYGRPPQKKKKVTAIAEGYDGSLWFGLEGGGIHRLNKNKPDKLWQRYAEPEIPDMYIRGLASSKQEKGNIWVATYNGIAKYVYTTLADPTEGRWDKSDSIYFSVKLVGCVTINPDIESIFFGTSDGITYYDAESHSWQQHLLQSGYQSPIISIALDNSKTIWCGKMIGAISYNPTKNEQYHYTPQNTNGFIPNSFVNTVITDFFGKTRWFGTNQGLVRLSDTTWMMFNTKNTHELPSDVIQALYFDYVLKNLWIGTSKGIVVYNEDGVRL